MRNSADPAAFVNAFQCTPLPHRVEIGGERGAVPGGEQERVRCKQANCPDEAGLFRDGRENEVGVGHGDEPRTAYARSAPENSAIGDCHQRLNDLVGCPARIVPWIDPGLEARMHDIYSGDLLKKK